MIHVRAARPHDAESILDALTALLRELRGDPTSPTPTGADTVLDRWLSDDRAGFILLAEDEHREVIGFVGVSWQEALRCGGTYALIQELWVDPCRRSDCVGQKLIEATAARCRDRDVSVIEVGAPGPSFVAHERVLSFYFDQGFTTVGPRLRKRLSR